MYRAWYDWISFISVSSYFSFECDEVLTKFEIRKKYFIVWIVHKSYPISSRPINSFFIHFLNGTSVWFNSIAAERFYRQKKETAESRNKKILCHHIELALLLNSVADLLWVVSANGFVCNIPLNKPEKMCTCNDQLTRRIFHSSPRRIQDKMRWWGFVFLLFVFWNV